MSIAAPGEPEDIAELKFVSDYDLQGSRTTIARYGLGVPLIAVHRQQSGGDIAESYYAPGMSVPMTAFLRVLPDVRRGSDLGLYSSHLCVGTA